MRMLDATSGGKENQTSGFFTQMKKMFRGKALRKLFLDEAIWFRDASGVISPIDNFSPFSHAKTLLWNLYKREALRGEGRKKYENCIQMVDETK